MLANGKQLVLVQDPSPALSHIANDVVFSEVNQAYAKWPQNYILLIYK